MLLTENLRATRQIEGQDAVELPWNEMNHNKAYLFRRLLDPKGRYESERVKHFAKYKFGSRANLDDLVVGTGASVVPSATYFDYLPSTTEDFHVYVNFADAELFGYWASGLFAQDEMQVAEHPALALLREGVVRVDPAAMKLDQAAHEVALVQGVPRLAEVSTALYGHAFVHATEAEIDRAVSRFETPRSSNILAMAARNVPARLAGRPYAEADVRHHLLTALTGFTAAKVAAGPRRLILHTGNWGTGAFGNDPELMAMVQIVAAQAAGVDTLVYHAVSSDKVEAVKRAESQLSMLGAKASTLGEYVRALTALGRAYGRGNGT